MEQRDTVEISAELEATINQLALLVEQDPAAAKASLEAIYRRAEQGGAEVAQAKAACALARCCFRLDALREGLGWARDACGLMARIQDPAGEVVALGHHGVIWAKLGDLNRAREFLCRGLEIAERWGINAERGPLLTNLALTYGWEHRPEDYARITAEAVALFRALGDRKRLAHVLANLGGGLAKSPDTRAEARAAYEEAIVLAREEGLPRIEAIALGGLGEIEGDEGHIEEGCRLLEEARRIFLGQGLHFDAASQLRILVPVFARAERYAEAIALLQSHLESAEHAESIGLRVLLLNMRSHTEEAMGDLRGALATARAVIDLTQKLHEHEALTRLAQQQSLQQALIDDALARRQDSHIDALLRSNTSLRDALSRERIANRTLAQRTMSDTLTGIANRHGFFLRADVELTRCLAVDAPLSLLLLDLDHFKQLNDLHGHPTGDAVLCEFTQRITSLIRALDIFARLGGEEFALLLPNCPLSAAGDVATRLCEIIRAQPFCEGTHNIHVTVSIGVVSLLPDEPLSSLISRADAALYRAKDLGRDRVQVAEPPQ